MSPKSLTKVFYKPDPQATEEYIIIVNSPEYMKWKDGDTTVPLAEIVDSFTVWHSSTGHTGHLGTASNQQLDTVFNTHKDTDVILAILEKGTMQNADAIGKGPTSTNVARGAGHVDSRGAGGHQ